MRYYPAAIALSLLVAVTASVGQARETAPADPRVSALLASGQSRLSAGDTEGAIGLFESALALDPGHAGTYIALGDAERSAGMPGKAIHYFREALSRDPNNLAAISGEGEALADKGAIDRAKGNLARLEGLCGKSCGEVQALTSAIARGPLPRVVAADTVKPEPKVESN
ncbi:MAG: tetratricopeptide repeat protein [Sphingomonadales bacterium]|nr:tetratricopeptide repeat protein [Sphingomonadales bacterium]MDE2568643.1 tetratricopeptide repeat protein [Sphingomonadales bacterium]